MFTTGEFGPNDGTWVERTLSGNVPAGARQVRIQLLAHNHSGSNTTHDFDDLSLSVSVRLPALNHLLRYDGSAWVGVTAAQVLTEAGLGDPGDVDANDLTTGYVLTREPDGTFALHAAVPRPKVRRHLRRHGQLHPERHPARHGAGLGGWPARDRLRRRRHDADLRDSTPNGSAIVAWDIVVVGIVPSDIGVYFPRPTRGGATLLQFLAPRAFTLPVGFTGSQGYAGTGPTAQADLEIQKNGASIGTITFAAAASAANFTFAGEVTFAAGDRLAVIAPGSQDASLADISTTFEGTRTWPWPGTPRRLQRSSPAITIEQFFDQTPTLNPRESAHCHVQIDFPASPTDDAAIAVYGSLDGTAWSATPLMVLVLSRVRSRQPTLR